MLYLMVWTGPTVINTDTSEEFCLKNIQYFTMLVDFRLIYVNFPVLNIVEVQRCRKGFRAAEGRCLAMVKYDLEDDRSWQSARTICIGLGGDLASLETPKLILAAEAIRQVCMLKSNFGRV